MNDQLGVALLEAINRLNSDTFGNKKQFIVDATHTPSPAGVVMEYCVVLEDITDFAASNDNLQTGSGTYATTLKAGTELTGGIRDISLTAGSILCVYK